MQVNQLELSAALTAGILVAILAVFFQTTRIGRALRAVADDHEAALSLGIPLKTIWVIVWSVAGIVAIAAGVMWGAKSGVQFSLSLIALKALPVLILGGFTSVPGAIVGGLIIGVGEKMGEVYWGPLVGGAIENWFAYVVALVFLIFRPQGLFGEKIIERV
jgi:branched-chain amino acid transport system permease protein